jgi:SNF2 family DNA or RNA helicase
VYDHLQAAAASTPDVTEQPEWVRGGKLYPHQLEAVNWLRRQWAADAPVLMADDSGLGKTATVIAFLQFLRCALVSCLCLSLAAGPSAYEGTWGMRHRATVVVVHHQCRPPCGQTTYMQRVRNVTMVLPSCRHEMEGSRPILIVAPSSMLPFWQGEVALWVSS